MQKSCNKNYTRFMFFEHTACSIYECVINDKIETFYVKRREDK